MAIETREETRDDTTNAAKAAAILGVVFSLVALGTHGGRASFSVAVGAAIAVANLLTLRAIIRAIMPRPDPESSETATPSEAQNPEGVTTPRTSEEPGAGRRGGVAWGIFAVFKILILFGGIWILLTRGLVDPIPLVVGYGVLPLGIAASTLWQSLSPSRSRPRGRRS